MSKKHHAAADHGHTMPNGGDVRIKTNSGETFIASTQRADGSWRKPRRVKAGYVPQDEQPRFECRAQVEQRQRSGGGTDANSGSKLPLGWDPVEMVKGVGGTLKQKQQTKAPSALAGGIVPPLLLPPFCPVASVERPQAPITPGDHLRKQMAKLEKKLDEIDKLKQKIDSGELAKPEQTQLDKLARRAEVEREVEQLSEQLANL
uniref:Partner of Y14 and mago n=1 Tax=Globodera rostochiensis TaxID=31243 RepID=A0A914HMB4_GLORO